MIIEAEALTWSGAVYIQSLKQKRSSDSFMCISVQLVPESSA